MVATTVLLNALAALRATLDGDAHDNLDVDLRNCLARGVLGPPLMLAEKAHDRVVAQIAKAHALTSRALNLHARREQLVRLQAAAGCEAALHGGQGFGELHAGAAGEVLPKGLADLSHTTRPQAAHRRPPLLHAPVNLVLGPARPAALARGVAAAAGATGAAVYQRDTLLAANGAHGTRLHLLLRPPRELAESLEHRRRRGQGSGARCDSADLVPELRLDWRSAFGVPAFRCQLAALLLRNISPAQLASSVCTRAGVVEIRE